MQRIEHRIFFMLLGALAILGVVLTFHRSVDPEVRPLVRWEGRTMGTHYLIQLVGHELSAAEQTRLRDLVEAELEAINQAMSTYIPGSEISRFNAFRETTPFEISARFREVLAKSIEMYEAMEGAFDPTIGPLIDLWGFDRGAVPETTPSEEVLAELLAKTGMAHLELSEEGVSKAVPELEINLSAIAKGYAVDRVASLLLEAGFLDLYVEIGGDLVVRGLNARGVPWRIGIQRPGLDAPEDPQFIFVMQRGGVATSGDYRNFREVDGEMTHHILDPSTGRPARTDLTSVTIYAHDCMTADAIATGLFVMGMDKGMEWVENRPGIEALLIGRKDGDFDVRMTPGMNRMLAE
ncbi:MAG: FAD:protein FMN transferase [Verrucomicrobia bacterium]|nr:FAD:protein FMN transferase [Verrucomicrobiota bacterium]MCH8513174.1 FAD:protein FMN transferase [Kiritimatiellia bacterium]